MNDSVSLAVARSKRVTGSDTEQTRHCAHPDHNPLPLDQYYYYWSAIKDVTDGDAFTKTPLSVTHLLKDITDSDALTFINFKFYFYHSYY
jgi:hypothetical protein